MSSAPRRGREPSPRARRSAGRLSPGLGRSGRVSPGVAREEKKWAWDMHKVVLIRRQNENFGFYIRGGKEYGFGIFVSGLDRGGHAQRQGLHVGDRILRVNEVDFREISHQEAVQIIQSASRLVVYVLPHQAHNMPEKEIIAKKNKEKEQKAKKCKPVVPRLPGKRSLTVIPEEDGYLGCSIRGGSDYGIEVCVSDVDAMSPSHRSGLRPGDVIKKINGIETKGMTHMQFVALATAFTELNLDVEGRGTRKMSLPNAFHGQVLGEFQPLTNRRRHRSGPLGVASQNDDFVDNPQNNNGEEDISNINFVQICNRSKTLDETHSGSDPDPVKVTKLISRTIRLNLNVATKDGHPLAVQASPKTMKRCQRTDVRDVFKERISLGSPNRSPKFMPNHARRASDFARSPLMSPKRASEFSKSPVINIRRNSDFTKSPFLNDLRKTPSNSSVESNSKGFAAVVNYAWNIPPVKWP